MNKKRLISLFEVIIIIAIIALIRISSIESPSKIKITDQLKDIHIPTINQLIDNSMSDFDQTEKFDREIEAFMRRWELKGGSFALMRNDSLLYAKGYGYANDSLKCDVNNVFRVASVSKLLTAVSIMKLVERKKITLDSQVFGEDGILNDSIFLNLRHQNLTQITINHLLRHTAGFSSPMGDPAFSNYNIARYLGKELPLTVDDMVLYATKNRLRTRPGGSYDYSNLGYIILGKVVEKVSNIDYESYVRDSILAPIGCYDIHIGHNFSENREPNEVNYYEVKEAEPVEAYDGSGRLTMKSDGGNNVTLLGAAGGWVASPTELLRFVAAIDGCENKKDILSEESVSLMTQNNTHDKPIGWATIQGDDWLRSGSMAGTTALIKRQDDGYTWVFISNSSAWISHYLSNHISTHITRAISKVKEWPKRDLFDISQSDSIIVPLKFNQNLAINKPWKNVNFYNHSFTAPNAAVSLSTIM